MNNSKIAVLNIDEQIETRNEEVFKYSDICIIKSDCNVCWISFALFNDFHYNLDEIGGLLRSKQVIYNDDKIELVSITTEAFNRVSLGFVIKK